MFNRFWPKLPEAEANMQTDNDTAEQEEYRRNWIASVDKDKEDIEEDQKEDKRWTTRKTGRKYGHHSASGVR